MLHFFLGGTDYEELTSVPVVFSPGIVTQTVTLTTHEDSILEATESFQATLTAAQSGVDVTVSVATITIVENLGMLVEHHLLL